MLVFRLHFVPVESLNNDCVFVLHFNVVFLEFFIVYSEVWLPGWLSAKPTDRQLCLPFYYYNSSTYILFVWFSDQYTNILIGMYKCVLFFCCRFTFFTGRNFIKIINNTNTNFWKCSFWVLSRQHRLLKALNSFGTFIISRHSYLGNNILLARSMISCCLADIS